MKKLLLPFLLFVVFKAYSQDFDHSPVGLTGEIEAYSEFTLNYSEAHEQPLWVAYYLTQSELALDGRDRVSRFITDDNISTGSATHDDYTNTGYDRGHLSRAEFNKRSEQSYEESFRMSNISPQIGANFNRTGGDWYNLEELEMDIAYGLDELYSVSGPIFKDNLDVIGDNAAIVVPGYFYKAFLSPDKKQAIAFVLKHDAVDLPSLWDAVVTIDELEVLTGMNFFGRLDNKEEKVRGSQFDLTYWQNAAQSGETERSN